MVQNSRSAPLSRVGARSIIVPKKHHDRFSWIPNESRAMGINLLGGKGSGKSFVMGRRLALCDLALAQPVVDLDPVGSAIDHFLSAVTLLSPHHRIKLWPRIRYIDAAGSNGHVVPCPFYYRLGNESLYEISQRPLDLIKKLNPNLETASIMGWPAQHRIGTASGMLLAALGLQITEVEDLLYKPEKWRSRWEQAADRYPDELTDVAAFFAAYEEMNERERDQKRLSFLQMLTPFTHDPAMRAMFGASQPGINWHDVIETGETVLIDFRHVHDLERRRFLMWWWFLYFLAFIKHRGHGRHKPVSLYLDELTAYVNNHSLSTTSLAQELDALVNVYSRSHQIWLTTAFQEAWQVDERIMKGLMGMGTQLIGRQDPQSAQMIAEYLYRYDPSWVRKYEPVWMAERLGPYVVDRTSTEYTAEEQKILNSHAIMDLELFQFLVRPARREGDVHGGLHRVRIAHPDKVQWMPDEVIADIRKRLAIRDGVPTETILNEIRFRQHQVQSGYSLPESAANMKGNSNAILVNRGTEDNEQRDRDLREQTEEQPSVPNFWSEDEEYQRNSDYG